MSNRIIVAGNVSPDGWPLAAHEPSFVIEEWSGSGPPFMHVHDQDDEAWHVLEGSLTFQFVTGEVEAPAGTTVVVPAGQPHTYRETSGPCRYLIVMTPRLAQLVAALHEGGDVEDIMARHASRILR